MAGSDYEGLKRQIEQAMLAREHHAAIEQRAMVEKLRYDYLNNAQMLSMVIKPATMVTPGLPAGQGRRLKFAPHSTEVSEMGRIIPLPPVTVTTDMARRMKQRLGLASFLNSGEFYVGNRFQLRWRKHSSGS